MSLKFQGFHILDGEYHELIPTPKGWLWSQQLELYLGVVERKLRFFTPDGQLVLLPEEEANQQLEKERQKAERLAERLRAAGIDPDELM